MRTAKERETWNMEYAEWHKRESNDNKQIKDR